MEINKQFKFNSFVYIVHGFGLCDYEIVKARVVGVREFKTAYSSLAYALELPTGETLEALPNNMYANVEELLNGARWRVVE